MTDAAIQGLLREYRTGRQKAVRDRIVMQYAGLVESVARRFLASAEPLEDLVQEGYIGLISAVDGYDAGKGVKFSTYATHFVIGQIKHHLRDRGKIIKEPAWLQELNQRVSRVVESLAQELGRPPSNAEIGALVGMAEEAVGDLLTAREVFKVASLDGGEHDDESPSAYDLERVKGARVEFEVPIEDRHVLETALQKLKDLEQTVVHEFFFCERNQTEIARSLGISCNYVSHILRNSTRKLRKILVSDELKEAQLEVALLRRRADEQAQRAEESSVVDGLTRLYNRRYFDNRLDEELNRASRHQHPVGILFAVLRGHEHVGRAYGTLRAEDGLRHAADLVRAAVRRSDIVTRYDGVTFGLILPHTGSRITVVVERVGRSLARWVAESGLAAGRAPVVVELGCAWYPGVASAAAALVEHAFGSLDRAPLGEAPPVAA